MDKPAVIKWKEPPLAWHKPRRKEIKEGVILGVVIFVLLVCARCLPPKELPDNRPGWATVILVTASVSLVCGIGAIFFVYARSTIKITPRGLRVNGQKVGLRHLRHCIVVPADTAGTTPATLHLCFRGLPSRSYRIAPEIVLEELRSRLSEFCMVQDPPLTDMDRQPNLASLIEIAVIFSYIIPMLGLYAGAVFGQGAAESEGTMSIFWWIITALIVMGSLIILLASLLLLLSSKLRHLRKRLEYLEDREDDRQHKQLNGSDDRQ